MIKYIRVVETISIVLIRYEINNSKLPFLMKSQFLFFDKSVTSGLQNICNNKVVNFMKMSWKGFGTSDVIAYTH